MSSLLSHIARRIARRLLISLGVVVLVCALTGGAQGQTRTISKVVIEGNQVVDAKLIGNVSGLKPGDAVSRESIQQAIHQIYGLGLFSDVQVYGEEDGDKLRVIIRVSENPRLDQIVFKGNKELKEKDFKLPLKRGRTISPHLLKEAERLIREKYQEKGFFLVDVQSELAPTPVSGEADAVFRIKENKPVGVEAVIFEGNAQIESGDLRGEVSNKPHGFLRSIFGGGKFNREKYAADKVAIIDYYKKKGFLDAVLVSDTIMLNEFHTDVTLKYTVNEGPRYYFGTTEFTGNEIFDAERLRKVLEYDEGDVFNQEKYEESIGNLYTVYQEEGYLYTRIIDDTKTSDSTVAISYEISEGVPAHVRRINIVGNVKTKDKVIRRELAIFPGQVFRRSGLVRSLQNVQQLNYFANVQPDYSVLPDGRVDLSIEVEEKPTGQIQVGGGYSGQDGFVGTVALGIPNLFGNGQEANISVDYGARRQSYSLGFTEPWFLDTPTSVGFDIFDLDREWDVAEVPGTRDYVEKRTGFGLRLGRRLTWPDDYFRVFWQYRFERQDFPRNEISDAYIARDFASGIDKFDWPRSTSTMTLTIRRDTRDLPQFATRGSRASYSVTFAGGLLGGSWSYINHVFNYARYLPVWKGITLTPALKLGAIQGGASRTAVDPNVLYYAGGIRSDGMVRGYDEGYILARTTPTGTVPAYDADVRGTTFERGRGLLTLNTELYFPLVTQQIYGLLFFDAGNVWMEVSDLDPFDMYTSYGFGFRLAVPGMGTLGFDFGIPLRGIPGIVQKGKLKPHFQFGSTF
jgi:outer membrane protein insertion porin family